MKENVFDVLIYLFENTWTTKPNGVPIPMPSAPNFWKPASSKRDKQSIRLARIAGGAKAIQSSSLPAFRVFSAQECAKLDAECRGFLMFLEQSAILTPASRELAIDRAMALNEESITLENLKWIVLLVLFSQPNEEIAFARMENLVYESLPSYLH